MCSMCTLLWVIPHADLVGTVDKGVVDDRLILEWWKEVAVCMSRIQVDLHLPSESHLAA